MCVKDDRKLVPLPAHFRPGIWSPQSSLWLSWPCSEGHCKPGPANESVPALAQACPPALESEGRLSSRRGCSRGTSVGLWHLSPVPAAVPRSPAMLRTGLRRTSGRYRNISVEESTLSMKTRESYTHTLIHKHTPVCSHTHTHTYIRTYTDTQQTLPH